MAKKYVIPIFVTHMGCPFQCIFCNQQQISGKTKKADIEYLDTTVEDHLKTISPQSKIQIGFYGGSFTGIPIETQQSLLKKASKYVENGLIDGIRVSTRPDYISNDIIELLKKYNVNLVELGVQSLDDEVLRLSKRGYESNTVYKAVQILKSNEMQFGIQVMTGLPGDTPEKSIQTAKKTAELNPHTVRIYPTLVIKNTYLEIMFANNDYTPQSLDEAVEICTKMLDIFDQRNINVIRVGLQTTSDIKSGGDVIAGPFHPSFRQLVESQLLRKRIEKVIKKKKLMNMNEVIIETSLQNTSNIVGHKKSNARYFNKKFNIGNIIIKRNSDLCGYDFRVIS